MPLYRYECEACGHRFRNLELNGASEETVCPSCGSKSVRRLLSRVSVQFKGSGYYKTDRANKKTKAGTKGASNDDSAGSGDREPISSSSASSE